MCCSPDATKGAARAVPVVLGEAPKDAAGGNNNNNNVVVVVAAASSARHHHHRFGRPSPASAARPLAVRRTAPSPRQSQTRVSREDLDRVRIELEQELAAGGAFSDDDIVERVSSSRRLHPLVVSIGECFSRSLPSRIPFLCVRGRRFLRAEALWWSGWRLMGRRVEIGGTERREGAKKGWPILKNPRVALFFIEKKTLFLY